MTLEEVIRAHFVPGPQSHDLIYASPGQPDPAVFDRMAHPSPGEQPRRAYDPPAFRNAAVPPDWKVLAVIPVEGVVVGRFDQASVVTDLADEVCRLETRIGEIAYSPQDILRTTSPEGGYGGVNVGGMGRKASRNDDLPEVDLDNLPDVDLDALPNLLERDDE